MNVELLHFAVLVVEVESCGSVVVLVGSPFASLIVVYVKNFIVKLRDNLKAPILSPLLTQIDQTKTTTRQQQSHI